MDALDRALLDAWNRLTPAIRADRTLALARARRRLSATYLRPIRPWCLALRASDTRLELHAAIAPVHPDIDGCPPDALELLARAPWIRSRERSTPPTPPQSLARSAPPADPDPQAPSEPDPTSLRAQFLILSAPALRALTKPVILDWPGLDLAKAARRLGRHPASLDTWRSTATARGLLKLAHYNARSVGKRGRPVPHVWSPTPLDPNVNLFEAPDPVWGTLWQHLHARIPDHAEFTLLRIPVDRYDARGSRTGDSMRHNGYMFICRGLPGRPCGQPCKKLYIPLPPFTLAQALGDDPLADITFPVPGATGRGSARPVPPSAIPTPDASARRADEGRQGVHPLDTAPNNPRPGGTTNLHDRSATGRSSAPGATGRGSERPVPTPSPSPTNPPPPHSVSSSLRLSIPSTSLACHPACHHCHRIRYSSLISRDGWNLFITHITAGLLQGHEVPRPASLKPTRKRRYTPHRRNNPADQTIYGLPHTKRQAQVLRALIAGKTTRQIAASLGITYGTAVDHVSRTLRLHGVTTRPALLARLNITKPLPPRLARLQTLLLRGLSAQAIARRMHITPAAVYSGLKRLYKLHKVHSRPDLLTTLRSQPIPLSARTPQSRHAA